ncbi:MAG: cryptochrome/photolyase family protein [Cyclobacteriaceae bacterium]
MDFGKWIDQKTTVFWFRRDLRLKDNRGLFHALTEGEQVVPVFIFDRHILDELEDRKDGRVEFIHQSLTILNDQLKEFGTSLLTYYGTPEEFFGSIKPAAVYCNHDYEPYALSRDKKIAEVLNVKGVAFKTFKDQVIFEKLEVAKDDGNPYTVFTPYSRKWLSRFTPADIKSLPSEAQGSGFKKIKAQAIIGLEEMGFMPSGIDLPPRNLSLPLVRSYDKTRDTPSVRGTSRLGIHLRFGTISIRQLAAVAKKENKVWMNELIWREFYQMILSNFPHVVGGSFRPVYDRIPWRNNEAEFAAWCAGKTGYPMVDAGMRELNATGFMHNRARMIVASFLTKHLLIDWRWGEAYFAKKLLDFELASNNGGWQWAAGSGCDAAPYFRVFSPDLQLKRFDPKLTYVRQWVPEFGTPAYPKPIVDHAFARNRAIETYKTALN